MSTFDLPSLISDPQSLDQIARTILKRHNEKPISKILNEFENENENKFDTKDPDYLSQLPKRKNPFDLDQINKMTKKDKVEYLAKSEKKNLKVLAQIKQKLKTHVKKEKNTDPQMKKVYLGLIDEVKAYFQINSHGRKEQQQIEYDPKLLNEFKILMQKIRSAKTKTYATKGKRVITSRFLQAKFGSTREIFQTRKTTNELTFNFVIDQSGSMDTNTLRIAELIKTFYKAVNDLPEIKINCFGFESNRMNVILNNENEINRIAYCGGGTPSCEAMTYASEQIKRQNGKQVIIFISDGSPNGISINSEDYLRFVFDDLKKYKQIEHFGILIGRNFSRFAKIFGSNFSEFNQIENANEELIKIFKMFIDEHLRNGI